MFGPLQKTGIPEVPDFPWGTHFCVFYNHLEDLIDILVPFISAGLENKESCLWVAAKGVSVQEVEQAMRNRMHNIRTYTREGRMEFLTEQQWYFQDYVFDMEKVLRGWTDKLSKALVRGSEGLRATGNAPWFEKKDREAFVTYEDKLMRVVANRPIIVLCTYSLFQCGILELMKIADRHDSALIRVKNKWEYVEGSLRERMKEALGEAYEELQTENARLLESERHQRRIAEDRLQRLKILSQRLVEVQESERRAIAQELHDEVGQYLTVTKLKINCLERNLKDSDSRTVKDLENLVNELMERVRDLSLTLRPTMLDDLGLLPALLWLINRYSSQTGIRVAFQHTGLEGRRLPAETETAVYRIVQEALNNIVRHAKVDEAFLRIHFKDDVLHLTIEDGGIGFDAPEALEKRESNGLSGMMDRVNLVGGTISIDSSPGNGTALSVELPIGGRISNEKKWA